MKKILLIDDEPDILQILRSRLAANGYAIVTAGDGEEGLRVARQERPDLIIVDIMMPRKDGFSFVVDAKSDEILRDIPVVVLTAKEMMANLLKMEGVRDYIVKPFESEQLLATVRKYL